MLKTYDYLLIINILSCLNFIDKYKSKTDNLKCKFSAFYFSTLSTEFIVVFSFFKLLKRILYNIRSVENVYNHFF